jgi:hypothetical protein
MMSSILALKTVVLLQVLEGAGLGVEVVGWWLLLLLEDLGLFVLKLRFFFHIVDSGIVDQF